jgi:hypothetical protein
MSEHRLDNSAVAKDLTPPVGDNSAVLANAANSSEGAKTLQAARAGAADTSQPHLPTLDISYQHTTDASGTDLQTWKDSNNRVIANEAKDTNGKDTVNTWSYAGNTDQVAATSTRITDNQGHTASNVQYLDQNGKVTYNEDDRPNGTRRIHQVTPDGTINQTFDSHGNSGTTITDNETGKVKSTIGTRADGSNETKLYDSDGNVKSDTINYADGRSWIRTNDGHGNTSGTVYDSHHRVTSAETKDASGNVKTTGFEYDKQTGIKTGAYHGTEDAQHNVRSTYTQYDGQTGQKTDSSTFDTRLHTGFRAHYENGKLDYEVFANNKGDMTVKDFDPTTGKMDYQESTHANGSKQQKWYDANGQEESTEID